jgi:hypothetical protein
MTSLVHTQDSIAHRMQPHAATRPATRFSYACPAIMNDRGANSCAD